MKKTLAILLALLTVLLASCTPAPGPADTDPIDTPPAGTEPSGTETLDTEPSDTEAPDTEPSDTEPPHVHDYQPADSAEADCTTDGSTTFTCSCGDSYTETVKATGHAWGEWAVAVEPTFAAEGQSQRLCQNCGEAETQAIAKLEFTDDAMRSVYMAFAMANFNLSVVPEGGLFGGDFNNATPMEIGLFIVDYLLELDPSKVESYCVYETQWNYDHTNSWEALTKCNFPADELASYANMIFGRDFDFSALTADGITTLTFPMGGAGGFGLDRRYHSFTDLGGGKVAIKVEWYTTEFGPEEITEKFEYFGIFTIQLHESGLWQFVSYAKD